MTQEYIDKVYADLAAWEKEVEDHNKKLIASISKTAPDHFKTLMDYANVTGKIEMVDKPSGDNQHEKYGPFKEVWVDQRLVGYEGDSFEGFIYAKIDQAKWIKVPYSC